VHGFAVVPGADEDACLLPYDEVANASSEGFALDHGRLLTSLRSQVAARPGVSFRVGTRVLDVVRAGGRVAGVRTSEGEIRAGLTVLADGRHSRLRSVLGIPERVRLLSFTAALKVEDVELPHPGYGHVLLGAPGPVLAYGIGTSEARLCFDLPVGIEAGRAAVAARLKAEYTPFVPEPLRSAVVAALSAGAVQVCANHAVVIDRCTAPGVALVGDAGGCCHPLTATGMTTGLRDVQLLSTALREDDSVDSALARYESRRRGYVRARELLADALYEVFLAAEPGTRALLLGVLRHWRHDRRARAATLALLSGHDSRFEVFAAEYARVLVHAVRSALSGQVTGRSVRHRAAAFSGLVRTSAGHIERTLAAVRSAAVR
jgi:2-polyprenyl-6-methoxyphenol hydroxylase-like FAD-dependent oxidoreductase